MEFLFGLRYDGTKHSVDASRFSVIMSWTHAPMPATGHDPWSLAELLPLEALDARDHFDL